MKKRRFLVTILTLLALLIFVSSCSKDNNKSNNHLAISSEKATKQKNKPLQNFDNFSGKEYFLNGSYKSKEEPDLKSVSWKKEKSDFSFVLVNSRKAFAGKYVDGKLNYGRIYKVSKAKNNFFNFKEEAFVIAESKYEQMDDNKKERFSAVNGKSIPGASSNIQYYQSVNKQDFRGNMIYRFFNVDGALIRESKATNNVHYYAKNVSKDD